MASKVAFIGGPSGVGKTSVGCEMHAQLPAKDVAHCVIDGDFLDLKKEEIAPGVVLFGIARLWLHPSRQVLRYRPLVRRLAPMKNAWVPRVSVRLRWSALQDIALRHERTSRI